MTKKVLMVCLGNICRSPLAQGILEKKIKAKHKRAFIDSAGISNFHQGQAPDLRSQQAATKNGIDISHQHARQITKNDFDTFDYIYAMDEKNFYDILKLARNEEDKAKVDMILNVIDPGENNPVPDPYYGGDGGFEDVFKLLDKACGIIADKIVQS